jgi:hypothetical protein
MRLNFGKTSELRGGGFNPQTPLGTPLLIVVLMLRTILAVESKVLLTTDEIDVSFSFLIFSDILLPGLNLLTQSRHSLFQSPTFWKLLKRIEPLKCINTPAFIVHIHYLKLATDRSTRSQATERDYCVALSRLMHDICRRTVGGNSRCPHLSLSIISVTDQLWI